MFVTENTGPFFLINDGTGSFRHPRLTDKARIEGIGSAGIYTAELVDVDRDGYVDILAGGHDHRTVSAPRCFGATRAAYTAPPGPLCYPSGVPGETASPGG